MRRYLRLVVCGLLLVTTTVLITGAALRPEASNGIAVKPNGNPAPALVADSWACYPTCVLPSGIAAGDMNSDGWHDIAVSCSGTGNAHLYFNQGPPRPGVFAIPSSVFAGAGSSPEATSVVPVTNGACLLARPFVSVAGGFQWQIHYTTGAVAVFAATVANPVGMVSASLDHNPATDDLVVLQAGAVLPLTGPAGGPYVAVAGAPFLTSGGAKPVDAVVADFNQDGWNDIAVATTSSLGSQVQIFFAKPSFTLLAPPASAYSAPVPVAAIPITPTAIDAGDFNADGLTDFVIVGTNSDQFAAVYLNSALTPGAAFTMTPEFPMKTWGLSTVDVAVADFDGNGRDDFAVANRDSHTVTMFLSDALPTLVADERATSPRCLCPAQLEHDRVDVSFALFKLELQCGYFPIALGAADFDWNGKVDLAVALESANPTICPQNPSCIEVIFDPACGFHQSGQSNVPNQQPHPQVNGVAGADEYQDCEACKQDPCAEAVSSGDCESEGSDSGK